MITKIFNKLRIGFINIKYKCKYKNNLKIGKGTFFRKRFNIQIEKPGLLQIGKNVFFNNDCSINCLDTIEIGNDSIFGENVKIYDHNHIFNKKGLIKNQGFSTEKVIIGNNCWIGSNVIILKGSHIGNNCVIGAGVVVNGNISDNSIVKNKQNFVVEKIDIH